jgi:hypothetical protein
MSDLQQTEVNENLALTINTNDLAESALASLRAESLKPDEIEILKQSYTIKEQTEILEFLAQNPSLTTLLKEVPEKIKNFFPNSGLFLEEVIDLEIPDDHKLVVFISPEYEPQQAFNKFKEFNKTWWLNVSKEVKDKLSIMTEYR